jgi:PAS domain S-box-containing protein
MAESKSHDYKEIVILTNLQQKVTKYITHGSYSLDESVQRILRTLCRGFLCRYAIIWLKSENDDFVYFTHWTPPATDKNKYFSNIKSKPYKLWHKEDFQPNAKIISRKTVKFGDKNNNENLSDIYGLGLTYVATFPIVVDGEVFGIMEIASKRKTKLPMPFIKYIEYLCSQLGQYIKRRRHSDEVFLNAERYRAIVELAPDIIYSVTENNIITALNSAFEKLTGMKKEDFIGKHLSEIFCPDDREETLAKLMQSREGGKPFIFQTRLNAKSGTDIYAEISESKFMYTRNEARRFGIIRDISEKLLLEKQKEIWIAMASHELRTPLTGIKAFTQILQTKETSEEKKHFLSKINAITDNMTNIIDDFLDANKINSNEFMLDRTEFKINDLICDVVESIKPSVEHNILTQLGENSIMSGDAKRVRQILSNLIINASKYSDSTKEIIIKTKVEPSHVLLSVVDFGVGINKNDASKIFGAYYRAKSGVGAKGLGLGLFITQAIVKAHNGTIWVNSKKNQGSTFNVMLPL